MKLWKKWQKRKHLSNLSPHLFCKFSPQVTLSRSSFIQTCIFHKNFSFFRSFSTWYIFFTIAFYSRQNFFYQFSFDTQKYFFEENEYDTRPFNFSFFIQINYHPISRKKKNEKPFFCIFFHKFKTHFLFWQVRVKFFAS